MTQDDAKTERAGEREFLEAYNPAEFARPSAAVDVALLTTLHGDLQALLLQRTAHPDLGRWALPGGFVGMDESLDEAALRVLGKKVDTGDGFRDLYLEQLYTFGEPGRDPRTRIITVAYYALVDGSWFARAAGREGTTAARIAVPWEGETGGPVEAVDLNGDGLPLAFDHAAILGTAVKRIRGKLNYTPIGFQLLADQFSLRELQEVHETVLGRPLNKDSFRRRMLASGELEATGHYEKETAHRPAELYRFVRRAAV
jgi:8-oxo-dGTP diphosphatase